MECNINSKSCCIIGHAIFADENVYRLVLKSEIEKLVKKGYTKFITYYKPDVNNVVIHVINEVEKQIGIRLFIELIFISSCSLNRLSAKKRNKINEILPLCDKTTVISDKKNKVCMNSFCDYLTAECNFLLCLEEDFRCDAGMTNKQILKAFKNKEHCYQVFDLNALLKTP